MTTATYTNKTLNETRTLTANKMTLDLAWRQMDATCRRAGWNTEDANMGNVTVKLS